MVMLSRSGADNKKVGSVKMVKGSDRLLIAGVPATGKSYFCHWLAREHGYVHIDIDSLSLREETTVLNEYCAGKIIAAKPYVVIDWGFPPENLATVQILRDVGFDIWWFDGDRARARKEFIIRDTVPIQYLNIQMQKIESSWEQIKSAFFPHLIDVLAADGTRKSPEEIWKHICGHTA